MQSVKHDSWYDHCTDCREVMPHHYEWQLFVSMSCLIMETVFFTFDQNQRINGFSISSSEMHNLKKPAGIACLLSTDLYM